MDKRAIGTALSAAGVPRAGVRFGLQHLAAAVVTGRAQVVAKMGLARGRLDRETRFGERVVGAMHAALGRRLLVLLNGHGKFSE